MGFSHLVSYSCVLRIVAVIGAALLPLVAGCDSGPRASVQGHVSFDGQVVDEGGIAFHPLGDGVRATGDIYEGNYHFDSRRGPNPGKYRVAIYWRKKTGRKVPGEGGVTKDEIEQPIPPKFNEESTLTVDVHPGRNNLDFDLAK